MARKKGTIKKFFSLWQNHEKLYYSIFKKALEQLNITNELRKDEDAISEALSPVLRKICYEYNIKHKQDIRMPVWEAPISPQNNTGLKGGKKRKRPDFSCNFIDPFATSFETHEVSFHIECKRLGKTKGSWNLNKNYITDGINRFNLKSHEYGRSVPSGMMIGYLVNLSSKQIVDLVNNYLPSQLPKLSFNFSSKVVSCEQKLSRQKVKPKRFKLIHLWADYI